MTREPLEIGWIHNKKSRLAKWVSETMLFMIVCTSLDNEHRCNPNLKKMSWGFYSRKLATKIDLLVVTYVDVAKSPTAIARLISCMTLNELE